MEEKAKTCKSHFGSSLSVVNSKIYVAGGYDYSDTNGVLQGNPAPVEVYDEEKNTWSVVEQKHISPFSFIVISGSSCSSTPGSNAVF